MSEARSRPGIRACRQVSGRIILAVASLAFSLGGGFSAPAEAQTRAQTLKILVPSNPGGGWDQTGRGLAAAMQAGGLARAVQIENKGGAGGTIGLAQFVSTGKGDPNALMIGGMAMAGAIALNKPPVTLSMVTPIARLTTEYEVLVVGADSPHKTLADLMRAFRADPGKVSWGGGSAGGTDHIMVGMIAQRAGVEPERINYIAFGGGGEAPNAVMGGHVTAGVSGLGEYLSQIRAGRMRALAVSAPAAVEGIPSLKEQGVDVVLGNWRGIFGPPGLSVAQTDALVRLVRGAVETPAWKATLQKFGWAPAYLAGPQFQAFLEADVARIGGVIDSLGLAKKKK